MWSYQLIAPYTFEPTELPASTPEDLGKDQVLLRFLAAGICGSDLPRFLGVRGATPGDSGTRAAQMNGYPIHEVVGDVLASRHPEHRAGDRVVGWASGFDGLMEHVIADGNGLASYHPDLPAHHAVALQPLACVLYAVQQLPPLAGRHVAVIGLGSIGLLFTHVAKSHGAGHVTGVDPVDRSGFTEEFGIDTAIHATSDRWITHLDPAAKPDIVIEAVGHQVATLGHAIGAAAFGGTVYYFGVPDDQIYPISITTMLRNNLTLKSGATLQRRRMLRAADAYAQTHPRLLARYITHTFAVTDVQAAFDLACRPTPDRAKIALVTEGRRS